MFKVEKLTHTAYAVGQVHFFSFLLTQFLEVSRGEKIIYFQEFFFPMKFWVGNGPKCDFFPKKYRGPRGGPKFFLLSLVALW